MGFVVQDSATYEKTHSLQAGVLTFKVRPLLPFAWVCLTGRQFPKEPRKFPAILDSGFNGFLCLQFEHFYELSPHFYQKQMAPGGPTMLHKGASNPIDIDDRGPFFTWNENICLCDFGASRESYNHAGHVLVESDNDVRVYLPQKLALSHATDPKVIKRIQKMTSDSRPRVPLIGNMLLKRAKLCFHSHGSRFSVTRSSPLDPYLNFLRRNLLFGY